MLLLPQFKDLDCDTRSSEDFNRTWPQSQCQLAMAMYRRSSTHRSSGAVKSIDTTFDTQTTMKYMTQFLESLCESIPPSVVSAQTIGEARFVHIINEYQLQRISYWFMAPPAPVRDPMINRLQGSKTVWTLYLSTKLFQALRQDPCSVTTRGYIGWIDKFEQELRPDSNNKLSLNDAADHLLAQLELVYLSFVAVDTNSGYNLFQKTLPEFLRLVAVDPKLTVEHPNGSLVVSFPRTLGAHQHELKRFLVYDAATAFVLGVPPLVEYGYDGECDPTSHGFQWVHGVPIALVETISQVNSWRAGSRVAPLNDWRNLESRVLAWNPQPVVAGDEPTGNVARLAVEEGWRHVALIYIYMGMCGTSSHDPRVQASIRQIVRLGESIADLPIGLHMFIHYVVAGIGARSEKQRSFLREKLLSFKGARVWLFRGPELSRVLDHLWHGVGAGGAPVTWDDYVQSRCAVVPI
ncbi:unnamed protein product [Rhizoctonia solani]|uniref:Fungal zn(2)-cys(6) binuclear cluster domain protein n=1 Tax=Rhizoctonia solani TaxID=456999 RepID=A0A8H3DQN1_9AGAM|nr:unnamed protein product [Rhizoctonia solani]